MPKTMSLRFSSKRRGTIKWVIITNFKMTLSCCTIVDRKDHVQYLQFQRAIPDDSTCSLTEHKIVINDHNDAMILSIGQDQTVRVVLHC